MGVLWPWAVVEPMADNSHGFNFTKNPSTAFTEKNCNSVCIVDSNTIHTLYMPVVHRVVQHSCIPMMCVPYFFTELHTVKATTSCVCGEHRDPNCTMSSVRLSPSRRSPRCPPPPPLDANTHVADAVPLPATNLSGGPNAEVDNFVDAFFSHVVINTTCTYSHITSNK